MIKQDIYLGTLLSQTLVSYYIYFMKLNQIIIAEI